MPQVGLLRVCIQAVRYSLNNCVNALDGILEILSGPFQIGRSTNAQSLQLQYSPSSRCPSPNPLYRPLSPCSPNYCGCCESVDDECVCCVSDTEMGGWSSKTSRKRPRVPAIELVGIEPNPGPKSHSKVLLEEIRMAKGRPKKGNKVPKAPPMSMSQPVVLTNRPAPRSKSSSGGTFLEGSKFNPRSDMAGYMLTLMDAEKHPPVRLGGETMVQTALAQLHTTFQYTTTVTTGTSVVIHPRLVNPFLLSVSTSSPYTYTVPSGSGFPSATVNNLQSLGSGARVVSCKLKVYTAASATNDNGVLIMGCSPRDDGFGGNVEAVGTSGTTTVLGNATSSGGFPITSTGTSTIVPTQGFNEFSGYDFTDTFPIKTGGAAFFLPQDPQSMIFVRDRLEVQQIGTIIGSSTPSNPVNASPICDPFFVVGITGNATSQVVVFELFLNLEYTVTSGANNILQTEAGSMNSIQAFEVVKKVGGNLQNYVEPSPEASLGDTIWSGLKGASKSIVKGGLGAATQFLFGSSDVGHNIGSALTSWY